MKFEYSLRGIKRRIDFRSEVEIEHYGKGKNSDR
jgi:hypothetical protein